jgi:hypothetical protein
MFVGEQGLQAVDCHLDDLDPVLQLVDLLGECHRLFLLGLGELHYDTVQSRSSATICRFHVAWIGRWNAAISG